MKHNNINPENTLLLVALQIELPAQLLPDWTIIYTGVDEVNASITASQAIQHQKPAMMLN